MKPLKQTVECLQNQQREAKDKMLGKLKKVFSGGLEPQVYTFSEPPVEFSIDVDRSKMVFADIERALDLATEACIKEGYPFPIVSGGSIRDGMLGKTYNDIDIFVDVSNMGDEELDAQDRFLLLADRLFPTERDWTFHRKNNSAYQGKQNYFELYEGVNETTHQTVQIIGHNNPTISSENPLDFTTDYPYNIIRNYASAENGIVISGAAIEGFKTKTIVCEPKGEQKAYDFYYNLPGLLLSKWKVKDQPHPKKTVKIKNLQEFMDGQVLAQALNQHPGAPWGVLGDMPQGIRRRAQIGLNDLRFNDPDPF